MRLNGPDPDIPFIRQIRDRDRQHAETRGMESELEFLIDQCRAIRVADQRLLDEHDLEATEAFDPPLHAFAFRRRHECTVIEPGVKGERGNGVRRPEAPAGP